MKKEIIDLLKPLENPSRVEQLSKYMQAHKDQESYAHGDIFLGIRVPHQRKFVKEHGHLITESDLVEILTSPIHEYRSIALIFMVEKFKKSKADLEREYLVKIYMEHLPYINHWDLVDISAPNLLGAYLYPRLPDDSVLVELANNESIWQQRMALVATLYFIKQNYFESTFKIANMLWEKKHPMVQKALGWMLKEIGEKDLETSINFVKEHLMDIRSDALTIAKEKYPPEIKKDLKSQRLK